MMGIFYIDDLAALKAIESLVRTGQRNREQKMHSAKVAREESDVAKRPKFRFAGRR